MPVFLLLAADTAEYPCGEVAVAHLNKLLPEFCHIYIAQRNTHRQLVIGFPLPAGLVRYQCFRFGSNTPAVCTCYPAAWYSRGILPGWPLSSRSAPWPYLTSSRIAAATKMVPMPRTTAKASCSHSFLLIFLYLLLGQLRQECPPLDFQSGAYIAADIEHLVLGAEPQGSVAAWRSLAQVIPVPAGYDFIRVKPPDKGVGCCFHVVPPSFPPRLVGKIS